MKREMSQWFSSSNIHSINTSPLLYCIPFAPPTTQSNVMLLQQSSHLHAWIDSPLEAHPPDPSLYQNPISWERWHLARILYLHLSNIAPYGSSRSGLMTDVRLYGLRLRLVPSRRTTLYSIIDRLTDENFNCPCERVLLCSRTYLAEPLCCNK